MSADQPEQWRAVVGCEDLYEVSDLGRVRSKDRLVVSNQHGTTRVLRPGRVLKPQEPSKGYLSVFLSEDGAVRMQLVARLVLEAFDGPRPEGMETRYVDGNTYNLALTGLRTDSGRCSSVV